MTRGPSWKLPSGRDLGLIGLGATVALAACAGHNDPLPDGVWREIEAWLDAVGPLSGTRRPS